MNIASSGVKGYEYQYSATLYIALTIGLKNIEALSIEKKGREDAFLQLISIDSSQINIEIQVKREKSVIDIPKLATWLTHFQENRTDNNLLCRLETGGELGLFITKSRCNDDIVRFKKSMPDVHPHTETLINDKWNKKFTDALSSYIDKTSKLNAKRKEFCTAQAKKLMEKDVAASVLKNVIIWEEVSDENLKDGINLLLNRENKIAQSQTLSVHLRLLEAIRKGRDEQINIITLLQDIISRNKVSGPVLERNYRKRPEEDALFKQLESGTLLLLTGTTLCGKSELAKQLAYRLVKKGYNYLIHTDVKVITQFFAQNPDEDKIAILEDPWGHLERMPEYLDTLRKIENFSADIQSNHKLIITSRREVIQELYATHEVRNKKIKGNAWQDLTISDSKFLIGYWRAISEERSVPADVFQLIENHLSSAINEEKLQIGQLQFLAGSEAADLKGKTKTELEHIARMNSQEIGNSIRNKSQSTAELLSILALTSTTTIGINKREFAYILSEDEKLYSMTEKDSWSSILGNEEEVEYPKYNSGHTISEGANLAIEYLERRFFISTQNDHIYFTHPNYFEAGRHLFVDLSATGQNRFLSRFKKALFTIHPDTAFLTSDQFSFLSRRLSGDYFGELVGIAFEGLNSIYPAVEDRIIIFLLEVMEKLTDEQKEILVSKLQWGGTSSSHIFWYNKSIPFINSEKSSGLLQYYFRMDKERTSTIEAAFLKNDIVHSYTAWQYLMSGRNTGQVQIGRTVLKALLQYREVFLRKLAAFLFITNQASTIRVADLDNIFADEHPSVVFEGIRGCFMAWRQLSPEVREQLIPLLQELIGKKAIAMRANHLMTTFAREHLHDSIDWEDMTPDEKKELWKLWGLLYPAFVKYFRLKHISIPAGLEKQ